MSHHCSKPHITSHFQLGDRLRPASPRSLIARSSQLAQLWAWAASAAVPEDLIAVATRRGEEGAMVAGGDQ